jgi:hypothetical protein
MKNHLRLLLVLMLVSTVLFSFGQGLENFNNYAGTSGTYSNGSFIGQDGSTWNYTQCRSDKPIVAPSPCLGKGRNPIANVVSGLINNGCGTLSFDYKQGFSSAVNLNVYVNNVLVGNVTSPGGNGDTTTIRNSGPLAVNVPGGFTIKFKQADSLLSGQVSIDNVTWTAFGGGPLPEPTNYPANFASSTAPFTINLSWTDATGGQAPNGYLVLGSDQNNIVAPVDGTPVPNDPNLADGHGALNVIQGVQNCSFGNLPSNKQFFFKIYPYTNSGNLINYKTDGTAPSVAATTTNTVIIDSVHFTNYTFGNWIAKNVTGDQVWTIDSIHGVNQTPCVKMSGYASVSNENEDWFISKSMNFNLYNNENLTFMSAYKYTGPALQCLISNDYDGVGNPGDFTWVPLTATWSTGNWVWTPSGNVNISGYSGTNIHIGFKYNSTTTESSTWELDDIIITGDLIIGMVDHKLSPEFRVSPNPAKEHCTLFFADNESKQITLLDMLGQSVINLQTSDKIVSLNLSGIPAGLYLVQVNNGNATGVQKLIIR